MKTTMIKNLKYSVTLKNGVALQADEISDDVVTKLTNAGRWTYIAAIVAFSILSSVALYLSPDFARSLLKVVTGL
ncbi:hypothetical protein [Dyadobacter sp. 22481]|uniref:hypothetical protein n=1 Tax=Dyadobacter sp. 22481 TaxID=3453926 RepID=UPI003F862DFB